MEVFSIKLGSMIVKNNAAFKFLIYLFTVLNVMFYYKYGNISKYLIFFEIFIFIIYLISKPYKIYIDDKKKLIYYFFKKNEVIITKEQIKLIGFYEIGLKGGGGYLVKLKFLKNQKEIKKKTILESISHKKCIEIKSKITELGYFTEIKPDY